MLREFKNNEKKKIFQLLYNILYWKHKKRDFYHHFYMLFTATSYTFDMKIFLFDARDVCVYEPTHNFSYEMMLFKFTNGSNSNQLDA